MGLSFVSALEHLVVIATALSVTWGMTPLVRWAGKKWGIISRSGGRNVHEGEIPRIGGVAIFWDFWRQ